MKAPYTPDRWVVLEFDAPNLEHPVRKVFAGWYGGFTQGESWKLNSGITKVRKNHQYWEFDGHSGSIYRGHPGSYGMSAYMHNLYAHWSQQAEERGDITIRILDIDEIAES